MFSGVPLIDGDPIVYRAAFACKDDEPVEHVWYTAKRMLEQIIDQFDRGLEYKVFLTGPGNYREAIAKEQKYKGNRTQPKPKYYQDVRDYMEKWWRAEVITGKEADDALGCTQTKETCIVSIDKDLDMIPGFHYNPVKQHYYEVSELDGWRFFYTQLLTGDRVDNIKGINKVGPKTAAKILAGINSKEAMEQAVLQRYYEEYGKAKGLQLATERGALLWIQRNPGEVWTP